MSTQWRTSMAGVIGLDYNAIPAVLRMTGIPRSDWPHVFECIRVLEDSALVTMRAKK